MIKKVYLTIGLLFGIWFGWLMAVSFCISTIDQKQEVMTIQDWSRLKELKQILEKQKFLFF